VLIKQTLRSRALFNGAPIIIAGRDVVPNVPDLFGGIGVRAVGAGLGARTIAPIPLFIIRALRGKQMGR
jgi:hypothetical protein